MPADFIEFENVMKSLETKNMYLYKFGVINDHYIEKIEILFDIVTIFFLY